MAAAVASPMMAGSDATFASPAGQASTSIASGSKDARPKDPKLNLTRQVMSSFTPSKLWKDKVQQPHSYTSLGFSDDGELLIAAGEDDVLHMFDCRRGQHKKTVLSKKYGAHLARFTHTEKGKSSLIYASTKPSGPDVANQKDVHAIRYHSLQTNNYISYFKAHQAKVVSLEMSPVDDTFLSGSVDDTVCLWDLKQKDPRGMLKVAGTPSVAYDPSGLIFAVTTNMNSTTLLYDSRKLDVEPFAEIVVNDPILTSRSYPPRIPVYTSAKFSNDGNYILIGTSSNVHYVLHSFNNTVIARLEGHQGLENYGQEADAQFTPYAGISGEETSWTPDSRYVISGSADGDIYIWDVNPPPSEAGDRPPPGPECTLTPIKVISGHRNSPSRAVAFNPRYGMLASGGIGELCFFLPGKDKEESTTLAHANAA